MKLKRFVALGATCLLLTGALTGCSSKLQDAQDNLNKRDLLLFKKEKNTLQEFKKIT